jgi:hypothetical protein
MYRRLLVVLALLGMVRTAAEAQTCTGYASYSTGPIQVAGHGAMPTSGGIYQYGASVGYGRPNSVFADANIARTSGEGPAYQSYGVDLGFQKSMGMAQICPAVSYAISDGPDAFGLDNSAHTATVGFSLGTAIGPRRLQIVPSGGVYLQYVRAKASDGTNSATGSDAYGVATAAVGVVLNSVTIRPEISYPVGLTGADPTLGLSVGFNFGK